MNEPSRPEVRRLGSSYVLDTRIGSGAQGEVWRAHSVDAPHEPLAVKLLTTNPADDDHVLERFLKERSTLMRVSSPYVVGVRGRSGAQALETSIGMPGPMVVVIVALRT